MPAEPLSDEQLLSRIAAGDAEAFTTLFGRLRGPVYRFALHMTASPSIADDVTQEVFLVVIRDAARYDPARATVAAWLRGIARNHVLRRLEGDRHLQPLEVEDEEPENSRLADVDPLGDLTRAERVEALRQAVLTLPIRYREAVVLCDLQELSYADAAAALGCAVGTVRSRLHRGRALLASKLTALEEMDQMERTDSSDVRTAQPVSPFRRMVRNARNLA